MPIPQIVIDTNVLVAGLRSRGGKSFRLLSHIGSSAFAIHLSVPLVLEYEEVLLRQAQHLAIAPWSIQDVIDYLCSVGA